MTKLYVGAIVKNIYAIPEQRRQEVIAINKNRITIKEITKGYGYDDYQYTVIIINDKTLTLDTKLARLLSGAEND